MIEKINLDALKKLGVSIIQFNLLLYLAYPHEENDLEVLSEKGYITVDDKDFIHLTDEGLKFVNKMTYQINNYKQMENIEDLVKTLREIFPTGKKPGQPYYWRGNSSEIERKIMLFKAKNPQYSNEQIVQATKNYVESYKNDTTYMQLLKYFIEKNGESQLLTFVENLDTPDEITKADWTSQIR